MGKKIIILAFLSMFFLIPGQIFSVKREKEVFKGSCYDRSGGVIIVLDGVSSSGKSTFMKNFESIIPDDQKNKWRFLSRIDWVNTHFVDAVIEKVYKPKYSGEPLPVRRDSKEREKLFLKNKKNCRVQDFNLFCVKHQKEVASIYEQILQKGFLKEVLRLRAKGFNVFVDRVFCISSKNSLPWKEFFYWNENLKKVPAFFIRISCSEKTICKRFKMRGDREWVDLEKQLKHVHHSFDSNGDIFNIEYDYVVDTEKNSLEAAKKAFDFLLSPGAIMPARYYSIEEKKIKYVVDIGEILKEQSFGKNYRIMHSGKRDCAPWF